tara:strand:+ start:656 stop:916 length:261 start_codon:yes stop_codon:yes gene_type:complete
MGTWSGDTTCRNCGSKHAIGWGDTDGSKGEWCNDCGFGWSVRYNGKTYDSQSGWMTLDEVNEQREMNYESKLKKLKVGRYKWGSQV